MQPKPPVTLTSKLTWSLPGRNSALTRWLSLFSWLVAPFLSSMSAYDNNMQPYDVVWTCEEEGITAVDISNI